jgi:hypothetical protein
MLYVASIRAKEIVVIAPEDSFADALSGFAARRANDALVVSFHDRSQLPELLTRLRDAGAAFAGAPHGWPPAEVFADLRDKGLVSGAFDEVVFVGRGPPQVRRR